MKVQLEPMGAVHIGAKLLINWSGREDSNLRPLPPENDTPSRIGRLSVALDCTGQRFDAICSRFGHGRGSLRTLEHCPFTPSNGGVRA